MTTISYDLIPNEPLRRALEDRGISSYQLAGLLNPGLNFRGRSIACTRISRMLGITTSINAHTGQRYYQKRIAYTSAVRIARAAHLDLVELGL